MSTYCCKDFTGQNLSDKEDMDNLEIEGSCFSQEIPHSKIFPEKMSGTVFIDCNLDNCFIPEGNKVVRGSQRIYQIQNDGEDWVVDPKTLAPLEPLSPARFDALKMSKNPKDIPPKEVR